MTKGNFRKWRRFAAWLRKNSVSIRNIVIFAGIVSVILWCHSQVRRDTFVCAYNEAVAKATHGPSRYRKVVHELETLESGLLKQRQDDTLLPQIHAKLGELCAKIAADDGISSPEGAEWWYRRAWQYDRTNEHIPEGIRVKFQTGLRNAEPEETSGVEKAPAAGADSASSAADRNGGAAPESADGAEPEQTAGMSAAVAEALQEIDAGIAADAPTEPEGEMNALMASGGKAAIAAEQDGENSSRPEETAVPAPPVSAP